MKFYALLDQNNIVINTSVADENWDSTGWVEYTENNPAYIGGDFYQGYFYGQQPYPSWTRHVGNWIAPIPMPSDHSMYSWDEEAGAWIEP